MKLNRKKHSRDTSRNFFDNYQNSRILRDSCIGNCSLRIIRKNIIIFIILCTIEKRKNILTKEKYETSVFEIEDNPYNGNRKRHLGK